MPPALRRLKSNEDDTQELATMKPGPSRENPSAECAEPSARPAGPAVGSAWPSSLAERSGARERLAHLAKTLESDVIPRLVGAHRPARPGAAPPLNAREVEAFVELLRQGTDAEVGASVLALQRRGLSVEALFLGVLAPAARHLGELWLNDRCDFSTVTVCLGRLQRLLREWSPAFGHEVEHPPNGRRILLAQHPEEQHSFGLSMVAEFFRRDGWEVLGGVGGAVPDPSAQVSRDWFDTVGFSVGSETRIDWLRERIAQVRASTRNRAVVVLVGGPLFVLQPGWAQAVGADACGTDAGQAPRLAEELLAARPVRR
jgi:methanogenic corrinoid protein MtbC1